VATSSAIQGTGEPVAEQDERNAESAPPDASSRPTSEGGADVPSAVPEHKHRTEDYPASETAPPIAPSIQAPASTDGGVSISSDRLFQASENPRRSDPPQAPDPSEHRNHIKQDPAPHSRLDLRLAWSGETLPRLETCAWWAR
jgi:hypothetical protein